MDRAPLREGGVRLWISTLGASLDDGSAGEARYEEDLPLCCRGEAASFVRDGSGEPGDDFQCPVCGAVWQLPMAVEPEFDAFTYRPPDESQGAA